MAFKKGSFKNNKKKSVLIIFICLVLVAAIVLGSILIIKRVQVKTFQSEDEMRSYVEGVYSEEVNKLLNYRITIKGDYITQERYGTVEDQDNETEYGIGGVEHKYHISKYDYQHGKIITDEDTYYDYANEKNDTKKEQHEFTVKANGAIADKNHTYKRVDSK